MLKVLLLFACYGVVSQLGELAYAVYLALHSVHAGQAAWGRTLLNLALASTILWFCYQGLSRGRVPGFLFLFGAPLLVTLSLFV